MYGMIHSDTLDSLSVSGLRELNRVLVQGYQKLLMADVSDDSISKEEQMINELLSPSRN